MRVLTSLFSAGREGTDKSEGVPPRAVGCIWAVCYNGGKRTENSRKGGLPYPFCSLTNKYRQAHQFIILCTAKGGEKRNIMKMYGNSVIDYGFKSVNDFENENQYLVF